MVKPMFEKKNVPVWVMSVALVIGFIIILRLLKRVSMLEAEAEEEKEENGDAEKAVMKKIITKFLDENKGNLANVKFSVVTKFQDVTKDQEIAKQVMRAAGAEDRAKLDEILKSL